MKTLSNHTLLYDHECPVCAVYTKAFVDHNLLDQEGRKSYQEALATGTCHVDWNRARNEIALVNSTDQTVLYGLDSILYVVTHSLPGLKPMVYNRAVYWFLTKCYRFISYNRKVIAPGNGIESVNPCVPDVNLRYRWLYLVLAWLVTSVVLVNYARLLSPLVPVTSFTREFIICGGQLVFQGMVVLWLNKKKALPYLGNMMTVSLLGALLLMPALLLKGLPVDPRYYAGYFMLVVGFMFLEHVRRVKLLGLPVYVSGGWVVYRLGVLIIVFWI